MTEHPVLHSTFTLERAYPAATGRVFAAWADPASKQRWFATPGDEHDLDFRAGGRESLLHHGKDGEPTLRFESLYHDIVPGERIVYSGTLFADDRPATVSITTVQFEAAADGTRLVLTEQGTFLDGREEPSWREQGTGDWLDKLTAELT
ncbi:polyketide cyclase [Actinomadura soli]|uniref:Polyketide cyclase n=1 Tax=Actinomadura soli TaxID=2508997 RepID=A0A5C4IY66_9ACTN|nr:SRPBCC family protein [Actinomadura soli]TMQ83213.1 polyketide cyclase [Actinomadura soli]